MALFPLKQTGSSLSIAEKAERLNFRDLPIGQDQVENFFRENLSKLLASENNFMILGSQPLLRKQSYFNMTAIDTKGDLVQIHIRHGSDPTELNESFEANVIQAAAVLSQIRTIQELIGSVVVKQIEDLHQFINHNKLIQNFNTRQRIVLIAPHFEERSLQTLNWLSKNGIELSCYELSPIKIGNSFALDLEKILPTEKDRDNFTVPTTVPIPTTGRLPPMFPNMQKLLDWKIINSGDRLNIRDFADSDAIVVDHKYVMFKGEIMPFDEWGLAVTGWKSINIFDWAFHQTKRNTLFELRAFKMTEVDSYCKPTFD